MERTTHIYAGPVISQTQEFYEKQHFQKKFSKLKSKKNSKTFKTCRQNI